MAAISRRVASALELRLSGDEQHGLAKHETESPEAYELYLKGRHILNTRSSGERLLQSVRYFEQATERAPTYAPARPPTMLRPPRARMPANEWSWVTLT